MLINGKRDITIMNNVHKVVKRNGHVEKFAMHKLEHSIHLAMKQAKARSDSRKIAHNVVAELNKKYRKKKVVDVEKIRNITCAVLRKNGLRKTCDYYMFVWLHSRPAKTKKVIKRDGRVVKFHPVRIYKSMQKAMRHSHVKNLFAAGKMTNQVIAAIDRKYKGKPVPVESIKDTVEHVLRKNKMHDAAKAYILYRYI